MSSKRPRASHPGSKARRGLFGGAASRLVVPGAKALPVGDGLGERRVEPARPGHRDRHLGHLEGVGQPGALVVGRVDHDLGLAGQPAERGRVHDPVAVALEAGALDVGVFNPDCSVREAFVVQCEPIQLEGKHR